MLQLRPNSNRPKEQTPVSYEDKNGMCNNMEKLPSEFDKSNVDMVTEAQPKLLRHSHWKIHKMRLIVDLLFPPRMHRKEGQ